MAKITLRGREIPLIYTVYEMKEIQEEICPLSDLSETILGENPEDENDQSGFGGPEHLTAMAKLVRILGNAGLEEAGENPDLTEKKILRAIKPTQISDLVKACAKAIGEGMGSEIPEENSDEPVDVTLEKLNKKKEGEG